MAQIASPLIVNYQSPLGSTADATLSKTGTPMKVYSPEKRGKCYTETTVSDVSDSLTSFGDGESVSSLSDFESSGCEKVEQEPLTRRTLAKAATKWTSNIASLNALDLICAGGKPRIGARKKLAHVSTAPLKPLPPRACARVSLMRPPPGLEAEANSNTGITSTSAKELIANLGEPMKVAVVAAALPLDALVKSGPGPENSFSVSSPLELAEWGRAAYPANLTDQSWDIGAQCAWQAMMAWQAEEWDEEQPVQEADTKSALNPNARLFTPGN